MSNSYVLGIAVGIAFGIMFVALVSYYLKKRGRGIDQYDERQKLAQLKGWRAAFAASACFNIIHAAAQERGKVYTAPAGACPRQYRHRRAQLPKHRPH